MEALFFGLFMAYIQFMHVVLIKCFEEDFCVVVLGYLGKHLC